MRVLSCAAVLMLASVGAIAHHSPAMFDTQQRVTLSGTVKSFHWTNRLVLDAFSEDRTGFDGEFNTVEPPTAAAQAAP